MSQWGHEFVIVLSQPESVSAQWVVAFVDRLSPSLIAGHCSSGLRIFWWSVYNRSRATLPVLLFLASGALAYVAH